MKELQTIETTALRNTTGGAAQSSWGNWGAQWAGKAASTASTAWNGAQAGAQAGWNAGWNQWNQSR